MPAAHCGWHCGLPHAHGVFLDDASKAALEISTSLLLALAPTPGCSLAHPALSGCA